MITFIQHNDIDKAKWDNCVEASFNKNFFCYSYVLDILSPGWHALVVNDYTGVFPVTARKKYGINYLFQPFFINYFDLYCGSEKTYDEFAKKILLSVPAHYKYIDICVAAGLKASVAKFNFSEQRLQLLDVSISYEKIQAGYSENVKRNIKKAVKEEIEFIYNYPAEAHVNDFKKENSKKIKVFTARDYNNMKLLLKELSARGNAFIVSALSKTKQVCASASFIICGQKLVYFKSCSNEYGKKYGVMHLLIDTVIKEYGGRYELLDFYGSNIESVARFNKGFNTNDYIYYKAKKNELSPVLKWIKK